MTPLKSLKKPEKQENPMEDSEYCFTQTLGKALVGFAKALELRQGKLYLVTTQDILEYSDVDLKEFEFLFGDPYGLLEAMRDDVHRTFNEDLKLLNGMNHHDQLICIFKRFRKSTPELTALRILGDHNVWVDDLRAVFTNCTVDWPALAPSALDYIYRCFCCQFELVMEVWEESGFSSEQIEKSVRLIEAWLTVDKFIAEKAMMFLPNPK